MVVALIGERIGMQHTAAPRGLTLLFAIVDMTIETVATDTWSRGIAAILVTCEVDRIK